MYDGIVVFLGKSEIWLIGYGRGQSTIWLWSLIRWQWGPRVGGWGLVGNNLLRKYGKRGLREGRMMRGASYLMMWMSWENWSPKAEFLGCILLYKQPLPHMITNQQSYSICRLANAVQQPEYLWIRMYLHWARSSCESNQMILNVLARDHLSTSILPLSRKNELAAFADPYGT